MKKLYKEYTVIPAGGTITLKANDTVSHYIISGAAVTITSGLTITIDTPSKAAPVKIYWNQPVTIGAGGAVTILGNAITEFDTLENLIFDSVYDGTAWKSIATQNLNVSTLSKPIWNNTVTVNYDMTVNDSTRKMFKTYADAITYINTQTPLSTDQWAVFLPSGLCNEDMTIYANIGIQGVVGTAIKSIISSIASTGTNYFDGIVRGCVINKVWVAQDKTFRLDGCIVNDLAPVAAATNGYLESSNNTFLKGDFSNTRSYLPWDKCSIVSTLGAITNLEMDIYNSNVYITNTVSITQNPHWRNSSIGIATLNVAGGIKNTSCYTAYTALNMDSGQCVFYNTEITGIKNVNGTASFDIHQATLNGGAININDTSQFNIYAGCTVDGVVTVDGGATMTDYGDFYDNTISGLTADNVKEAIDELKSDIDAVDVEQATRPSIETGIAAPATAPVKIGDIYVDTSAKKLYFAVGTATSADWIIAN